MRCSQVVLEFPAVFWDDSVDFFGAALDGGMQGRGRCFMFWNLHRFTGHPQLTALLSGDAANQASCAVILNPVKKRLP